MTHEEIEALPDIQVEEQHEFYELFWRQDEHDDLTDDFDVYVSQETDYNCDYNCLEPGRQLELMYDFLSDRGYGAAAFDLVEYIDLQNELSTASIRKGLLHALEFIKEHYHTT